jgi:hypothetical protein
MRTEPLVCQSEGGSHGAPPGRGQAPVLAENDVRARGPYLARTSDPLDSLISVGW